MSEPSPQTADPTDTLRQRYVANLAAIYRQDPALAAEIEAIPFAELPPLEQARDGNLTVRLSSDDGRDNYVHSRYRPVEEAERFVEKLPTEKANSFFLSGLGLGYHVRALEEQCDRPLIIVAEDNLPLLKAALAVTDLAPIIGDGRLVFLTTDNNTRLHQKLGACNADLMTGLHMAALPHTQRHHAQFHETLRKRMTDFMTFSRIQIFTLLRNARITFKNVASNLGHYLANPGVSTLHNRAAGYPAIIVAAGPSLARNIRQLEALRERAVVITVQTTLKLLRSLSIRPHFVTSLDFHEVSREFFHGIEDFGNTTLVAEPKATWHVLDAYGGPKCVLTHRFYDMLLHEHPITRGGLPAGATVAHLAFYLAQHLGCDPIIFVGQDLSFSEGLFYLPGSPIEKTWRPELNRFQTIEMKQWERIIRNKPILRTFQDLNGRDVYADDLLYAYREQFEKEFGAAPQRLIQASEGGIPLAGTEVMTLADAAEQFCARPLPADLFETPAPDATPTRLAEAEQLVTKRLDEVRELHKISDEMIELLKKLETLVERPAEFNKLIVRVDALRSRIAGYSQMYKLVVEVSAMAELKRHAADRAIGSVTKQTPEIARKRLERDRDFVESFRDGCQYVEEVLPQVLERLREQTK